MTESKRYYATQVVSRQSIVESNDMALVMTEKKLLISLYMEADMPRDFRIQFRYEPLETMDAIKCVGMLTVIDPTNPRIEEDKEWFRWLKHAPVREDGNVTYTNGTVSVSQTFNALYEPVIRKQLEEAAKFNLREGVTFDALSGLGSVKAKVQRDLDGYDDD